MIYNDFQDSRGLLEKFELHLDFIPREVFFVSNVPVGTIRGGHAHHTCEQTIVLNSGAVSVELDNGKNQSHLELNTIGDSVQIKPMTWSTQRFLQVGTEIMVFCSERYDKDDYINDYEGFRRLIQI